MPDARLIEIETKLAFQEDLLQTLNDIVTRQQNQIDQLAAQQRRLVERLRQLSAEPATPLSAADEKPPHY